MIKHKYTVELEEFISKSAGKLRAFRAAAVAVLSLLALSCSKDEFATVCLGGECEATMEIPGTTDVNGYHHIDLSWDQEFYPYFILDINATPIDPSQYIGGNPVATGRFDSDTTWIIGDTLVVKQVYYEPFTEPWTSNGPLPSYSGNLLLSQFAGTEVNVAQGTSVYFSQKNGEFTTKRTIGPFPPHMINDTITVFMEVTWRGSSETIKKSHYSEKFIIE